MTLQTKLFICLSSSIAVNNWIYLGEGKCAWHNCLILQLPPLLHLDHTFPFHLTCFLTGSYGTNALGIWCQHDLMSQTTNLYTKYSGLGHPIAGVVYAVFFPRLAQQKCTEYYIPVGLHIGWCLIYYITFNFLLSSAFINRLCGSLSSLFRHSQQQIGQITCRTELQELVEVPKVDHNITTSS